MSFKFLAKKIKKEAKKEIEEIKKEYREKLFLAASQKYTGRKVRIYSGHKRLRYVATVFVEEVLRPIKGENPDIIKLQCADTTGEKTTICVTPDWNELKIVE